MIFDFLENIDRYPEIPYAKPISDFLAACDAIKLPDGEREILGRDLFVRIAGYSTGSSSAKKFEAHTVYADLQFIAQGAERMNYSLARNLKPSTHYDKSADIQFFEPAGEDSSLLVSAGQFVVFFPGELHMPGCDVEKESAQVKKLVFKLKMSGNTSVPPSSLRE